MSIDRYWQLIAAGYKPEQIVTCPLGDPCPCEVSISKGGGYVCRAHLQHSEGQK